MSSLVLEKSDLVSAVEEAKQDAAAAEKDEDGEEENGSDKMESDDRVSKAQEQVIFICF